jgi:hypothetical protein
VERKSGKKASVRCRQCGTDTDGARDNGAERLRTTYQVLIACGSCGTPFVALSRN